MCKKEFQKQVSREDVRLKNPQIAVFVIPTEFGPIVPIIKRRKILPENKLKEGVEYLRDKKGYAYEEWFDLPGGKADPIFDLESYRIEKEKCEKALKKNSKFKGKPEDTAKIIDVEQANKAAMRETDEETGLIVYAGAEKFAEAAHPIKGNLTREFHAAVFISGKLKNMVPTEHDYVVPTDPENAIIMLGQRIPQEVRDFIRQEAQRITQTLKLEAERLAVDGPHKTNIVSMALYRDREYLETLRKAGYPSLLVA